MSKRKVKVMALKGVEYPDVITAEWFKVKSLKFSSPLRALLFIARVNRKQYGRYPDVFRVA